MKTAHLLSLFLLATTALHAQSPADAQAPSTNPPSAIIWDKNPATLAGPVAVKDEPHHRLLFQNDYVHAYDVQVPAQDATLLHQHDLPYLWVTIGPSGITNSAVGKPDVHLTLQDSEVRFAPGPVIHIVKTDSGTDFHNVTVEFVHPQSAPRNLCAKIIDAPLACPSSSSTTQQAAAQTPAPTASSSKKKRTSISAKNTPSTNTAAKAGAADPPSNPSSEHIEPYFETTEVHVDLVRVSGAAFGGYDYTDASPQHPALLIALDNSSLDVELAGQHSSYLHGGDVLWLPAGTRRSITDFLGAHSTFLLLSFND